MFLLSPYFILSFFIFLFFIIVIISLPLELSSGLARVILYSFLVEKMVLGLGVGCDELENAILPNITYL